MSTDTLSAPLEDQTVRAFDPEASSVPLGVRSYMFCFLPLHRVVTKRAPTTGRPLEKIGSPPHLRPLYRAASGRQKLALSVVVNNVYREEDERTLGVGGGGVTRTSGLPWCRTSDILWMVDFSM